MITLLGEKIREAASVYPDRDFGRKPFIYDCDSISFQVYLMIVRKGVWKQKIMVEKI